MQNEKKVAEKEELEPEDIAKLEQDINKKQNELRLALGIANSINAGRPVMASAAQIMLKRMVTTKQIGKATINAQTELKRSATSIEQNTQEKGEIEKDDN